MKRIKSWNQFKYLLESYDIISNSLIEKAIDDFWQKKVSKIEANHQIIAMFRISTSNNLYLTLGYLQKLNKDDKDYFTKYIKSILSMKADGYQNIEIDSIIIDYGIREGYAIKKVVTKTKDIQNYKHYKLPITMNPLEYGYVIFQSDQFYVIGINSGTIATIETNLEDTRVVNNVTIHRDNVLAFKYKDISIDDNKFKRIINNRTYTYSKDDDKDYSLDLITKDKDDNDIEINFRDSLQILLSSLKKLGKSFQIETEKGIFPYKFVTKDNLDYNWHIPRFDQFIDVSNEEYNNYYTSFDDKNSWNLKEEAIKYCIQDCISLYQIMIKFNELFFNKFHININDHPTLPSLAFRLFRSKYLKDSKIPMIFGDNYNKLKLSYTGGAVDMYIPTNDWESGELVYGYDVNSLYPFIMANYPMPIGNIQYFEGDIRKYNPEAFGFFYCKIEVPEDLMHPILQTHVKTKSGLRTIAGSGIYHDMLFSHSMDTAIKAGYKIEILWGYIFDKSYIFKDYVNDLYNLRLEYPKSDPMNYIAKILLNSLYGRFGMRDDFDIFKIVDSLELDNILNDNFNLVKDYIKLDEHFLVQIKNQDKIIPDEFITKPFNINVAIASAITSYSRDFMSQFKNNPKLKLFYTDTDSIYTNLSPDEMNELYPGIVSSKGIGKLKHEGTFKKAIFLAPKCYVLEDLDGNLTYKVKGLIKKVPLLFKDFEALLEKDSILMKSQKKWQKNLSVGCITVLEQSYTLRQTDNKRELIFIDNKVVNTKPYKITESDTNNVLSSKNFFIQNKFIITPNETY